MAKLTLDALANLNNQTSAVNTINANSDLIETALENTLSRDGTSPNSMSADIDLNGYDLINVGNLFINGDIIEADVIVDYVDFNEASVPSSPSANTARLYAYDSSSLTRLAYKDSSGNITNITGGPTSSTDNAISRFDGTTGNIQNSGVTLSDTGVLAGARVTPTGASTSRTLEARFTDVYNVKDYGAVGDGATNDTTAVSAALTAIGSSLAALYFPPGTYLLTPSTISKALVDNQSLKIFGAGTDSSILYFNATGNGLSFTFDTSSFSWVDGNNLIFEDLSFVTNVNNSSGSAIVIDGNCTIGNPNRPTVFNRVGFRGTTTSNTRWGVGLNITDLQNVEVNDCYYFSNVLGVVGTGIIYNGASDPAHPTVLNVHNWQQQFGEVGIHCTGYVEGLNVVQSNFTQTNYGILVDTTGSLPMFSSTASQYNCNLVCIQLTDCAASQIVSNILFTNAASATGIVVNQPYHTIVGNTFVSNAATCNGIILQSGATNCCIASNVFKNFTTNIWLQSGANNNAIGSNRHADGTPVFDQGTGNIWFTETATAFSPRASDGQALGTTALMWSDLHLASGGVVNWNNGDATITHSTNQLAFDGADTSYIFRTGEAAGSTSVRVHNTDNTNVVTKLSEVGFYGTDTINVVKEAARIELVPVDSNWTNSSLKFYTRNAETVTNALTIGNDQSVRAVSATGGIGYGTGAGSTVTQITNKTTGVTLNRVCGQITMEATTAIGAGANATFTLTNSAIATTDVIITNIDSGGTANAYTAQVCAVGAGSCAIKVTNTTGGSLSEAPVINFAVIKSVTS